MNKKHLLLTIFAFGAFALTAKAQTTEPPKVTYTTADGLTSTLTLEATTETGTLKDAVTITVTGELPEDLIIQFRMIFKENNYRDENNVLTKVDMSGTTLKPRGSSTAITNMVYCFYNCTALETVSLPELADDVETIDLEQIFYGCSALQTIENLGLYTGVSSFHYVFFGCKALQTITLPEPATPDKVIRFSAAFSGCTKLHTIANLDKYTGASNFGSTFNGCEALQTITLPKPASTATGIDFSNAFQNCKVLQTINNLELYTNVSGLGSAFYGCEALETVTLPLPATTDKVNSFLNAFFGCKLLHTITNLELYTGVSNFNTAFKNCTALQSVTLPKPADAAKESNFNQVFSGCTALQTIGNLELYTNVSSFAYAFNGCSSLLYVKLGNVPENNTFNTFKDCNPNCLKYLPAGTTEKPTDWNSYGNFLAMSADAEATALTDITLTDATSAKMNPYYCPMAFSLSEHKITYTRNFTGNYANGKNGWNTIAVPFAATLYAAGEAQTPYATTTGTDGAYWLRTLDATAAPANESTVNFAPVTTIEAYTPYIIAIPGNGISGTTSMEGKAITFEASGITVPATPDAVAMNETTSGNYRFVPTFTPIREQKMYLLERGTGENPDTFTLYEYGNLLPFRAYIADQTGTNNAPRLAIGGSGAATGIAMQQLSASDGSSSSTEIPAVTRVHSIDGRLLRSVPAEAYESRLDGLQPGIYLVNGQKEMVK